MSHDLNSHLASWLDRGLSIGVLSFREMLTGAPGVLVKEINIVTFALKIV